MAFVSSAVNGGPGLVLRAARIAAAYGCLEDNMPLIPIFVPDDVLDVIHEIRPKDQAFNPFIVDLIRDGIMANRLEIKDVFAMASKLTREGKIFDFTFTWPVDAYTARVGEGTTEDDDYIADIE